ncbi:nuak family kinase 1 [Cochliomyia hominivorax]
MVVENQDTGGSNNAHPSGIPQDQIDNIMSGIANTGDVKMNNHRKKLRQRFDIIKKLGQGTYGKVQLGINKETGQEVAIKTIKKCKIEAEADLVRIRREVQIMSSVQHPNIIHIYEVFENREKMVLVMEFAAGGELYDYLSERKVLSEEEARRIFRQVATAVYYCHKHKICHRDLKLENILLDENGNAKIADFGLSNVFDEQCLLATFCGSPLYASPEIVEGTPYHGPEVDCWSLGVLLYTLVYGSMPFDGSNFKRLVKQISQGDYYEPKKPSRASSLIKEMLTVCPRKRATIEQICSHWWVNENDNVSCLELAEDLANRTPVRLDVLLSLTPAAITAEQLVVPSAESSNSGGKNASIPRSHSVGSIREVVPNTEAERRILNMVAAGGEAALMPSPTRTITPSQSPVQTKRKLENTISTDNAGGVVLKKKDKIDDINVNALLENESTLESASVELQAGCPTTVETESMETDDVPIPNTKSLNFSTKDMELVDNLCEKLITDKHKTESSHEHTMYDKEKFTTIENMSENTIDITEESPERTKGATKVIKKFVNKHKTADLVNVIGQIDPDESISSKNQCLPDNNICTTTSGGYKFVRKCSLQDETPLNKFSTERRKSRILETAEKFQQMNNANVIVDRAKKIIIPGVSVGNFKKEYERKTLTGSVNSGLQIATGERRTQEKVSAEAVATTTTHDNPKTLNESDFPTDVEASDSKTSVASFSLDEARRSMENSIALLRQAQTESSKDVNQLCAKTDNIHVSESHSTKTVNDRERKLMNARAIIGNAIQPVLHRPRPLPPLTTSSVFGKGGGGGSGGYAPMRAVSGSFLGPFTTDNQFINYGNELPIGYRDQQTIPNMSMQPPNANVALAAARHTLMGRLAAGGIGSSVQPNNLKSMKKTVSCAPSSNFIGNEQFKPPNIHFASKIPSPASNSSFLPTSFSPSYTQSRNPLPTQPFGSAATTTTATNANAKSLGATTITNSTNVININSSPKPFYNAPQSSLLKFSQGPGDNSIGGTMKTSTASITLKSATLPRRKTAKTEIQLDIKPPIAEQPSMRFTTEMQHPVADLRSAPPREGPVPYSPIKTVTNQRSSSLEPKEHVIPIQRPPSIYTRTVSNTTNKSGSLSRQSTNDSESDTINTSISQATVTGSSQPIKKSPREFIIPIAVEGGGFITPREGSIEPSESSQTTATTSSRSTFTRLRPTRRIGSMLSESGVDEVSPFQKLRTSSSIRDGDDDARFTLHKLRSSRPVKKISQENDSQSSGEEDDDDGFEILTAENLFSTLLQRVRALTNRMNVNNDITSAFPTSSSLLSNMRQAQSPFWNQEPFGRSKVCYTYSETIEKRQVRLNSASINAPWRHSMARDLGSDMDSMFSRTGATLPRDTKASDILLNKKSNTSTDIMDDAIEEPLDLADLDLSRLRLSKKDLETLSNIAPGLPKSFQEQLLAKLPPTQARKLSRTLSVQTNQNCALVQISKRSHSSTRNVSSANKLIENDGLNELEYSKTMTKAITEKPTVETKNKTKSSSSTHKIHSRSKSNDENSKDFGSLCNSEISDKYKYYSPYVNKIIKDASHKNTSPKECSQDTITVGATLGRPPSGRVSPTSLSDSNIKKPVQRRISRLIRPDIFEMPLEELETAINDTSLKIKNPRHSRNRSVELLSESSNSGKMEKDTIKHNRRSLSRSRDIDENNKFDKNQLADKILQELQILSSIRSQEVDIERGNIIKDNENINEKSVSINKKNKKLKAKEKPSESFIEIDLKDQNSVVKKIKKIVKKSETLTTPVLNKISNENLIVNTNNEDSPIAADNSPPKKLSKLKRPKSYPMKDCISNSNTSEICSSSLSNKILETNGLVIADPSSTTDNLKVTNINNITPIVPRDSRILRPKSYPTSKLITPKETKHTNLRKKVNTMDETTTKCTKDDKIIMITSHVSDLTSSGGKNIKKNKNSQYSSITTTPATTTNTMSNTVDESKESIPVSSFQLKDKGGEKKTNKGLLYAIGQKFEKLRASATSNSCANPPTHKKTSCDKLFPEKTLNKLSEVKETKSLSGNKGIKSTQSEEIKTNTSLNVAIHNGTTEIDNTSKPIKSEKRSRIDTMIRNLRERSVPRSQTEIPSESNYIKRAVSVEEMPGTFNKKSVNKVLGLFKRYEKDVNSENQVRSVRSTSNIEIKVSKTSPVYQNANAIQKLNSKINKCGDGGIINRDSNKIYKTCNGTKECRCDMIVTSIPQKMCPDCCIQLIDVESSEGNQEKRKGLVLDLIKSDKIQKQNNVKQNNIRPLKSNQCLNENLIYSNIAPYTKTFQNSSGNGSSIQVTDNNNISSVIKKSNSSINNNNSNNQCSSLHTSQTSGYRTSSTHEMNNQNNNLLSPSFENIGNYSSDSRSYQEDCASTSTFLSPTEDAELCFDTWSICSEDNYRGQRATPSPTVSHLSRASQASSPTRRGGDSSEGGESVVDRIKRRSFYCRFNEKKPKRTSSIVGPNAVREYYREQSSASKTRSSTKISLNTTEREHSPDITQEFLRPLKLSPIGTELKPPVYRSSFSSTHDYSTAIGRPRKSLNDIRTPTSPSCISERRYASFASPERELHCNNPTFPSRYKSNIYDDTPRTLEGGGSSNTYYNTYNPKRRFSFNTNIGLSSNGINSNICSQVEGYATMGRRPIRAYDHRTMSLLDTPNSNTYRHEGSTSSSIRDYTASLSRSNSRYRKSSVPRSPTNI